MCNGVRMLQCTLMKKKLILGALALVCIYILAGAYFEINSKKYYVAEGKTCSVISYSCPLWESYIGDEIGCGCKVSLFRPMLKLFAPVISVFLSTEPHLEREETINIPSINYENKTP